MFIDKRALQKLVDYINLHINRELEDYMNKIKINSKWDLSEHAVHNLIEVIESIVKRSDLTYNDFDLRLPVNIKLHLFDGYVEQYKEDSEIARNHDKLSKFL